MFLDIFAPSLGKIQFCWKFGAFINPNPILCGRRMRNNLSAKGRDIQPFQFPSDKSPVHRLESPEDKREGRTNELLQESPFF